MSGYKIIDENVTCRKCNEVFTDESTFVIHNESYHGESLADITEVVDAYQNTMNPDLSFEALLEAKRLLNETNQQELHHSTPFKNPKAKIPTKLEPHNSADDIVAGVNGYNDNPNSYFYDNKKFRKGASTERTGSLGEAHDSDDQSSDFQYHKADSSDLLRTDQRHRNADGSIASSDDWDPHRGDQDKVGRADYRESRANEYDSEYNHDENSAWKLHSWDDSGDGMQCGICGKWEEYETFARKSAGLESDTSNYEVDVDEYLKTGEPVEKVEEADYRESRANEDDPDFANDADFEGKIDGQSVEPSQYTQSGMDHDDEQRGDVDFDFGDEADNFKQKTGDTDFDIDEIKNKYEFKGEAFASESDIMQWITMWGESNPTVSKLKSFLQSKGFGEEEINNVIEQHDLNGHLGESNSELARWETARRQAEQGDNQPFIQLVKQGGGDHLWAETEASKEQILQQIDMEIKNHKDGYYGNYPAGEANSLLSECDECDGDGENVGTDGRMYNCSKCNGSGSLPVSSEADNYTQKASMTNNEWEEDLKDLKSNYQTEAEDVEYEKEGPVEQQGEDKELDEIPALEGIDFGYESYEQYPTKASEGVEKREKSYITETYSGIVDEYDRFQANESDDVKELVEARKMQGYNSESIAKELTLEYGVSRDDALEKVYSIEVSVNDQIANTFFGKRYSECNESEIHELSLYAGSDE